MYSKRTSCFGCAQHDVLFCLATAVAAFVALDSTLAGCDAGSWNDFGVGVHAVETHVYVLIVGRNRLVVLARAIQRRDASMRLYSVLAKPIRQPRNCSKEPTASRFKNGRGFAPGKGQRATYLSFFFSNCRSPFMASCLKIDLCTTRACWPVSSVLRKNKSATLL